MIYTVLKTIAVTAFKVLLVPFIGPFAWLISQIVDLGLDRVENNDIINLLFTIK